MERYYDAHLYLANGGSRRVMLRLPTRLLALAATATCSPSRPSASPALGETADDPRRLAAWATGRPPAPSPNGSTQQRAGAPARRAIGRAKRHGALTSGIRTARRTSARGGLAAATSCPGFDLRAE
jgi:hypothetical protein